MKICCMETVKIPPVWIGGTHALQADFFSAICDSDMCWIERAEAETNPAYKQIIPYVVMQNYESDILCYPRHGAEQRLHGLYSCGIGGHIDEGDNRGIFAETVKAGLLRELSEELLNFNTQMVTIVYKGIINEIETPVGSVHFGLVYLARCNPAYNPEPSDEIAGMEWKSVKDLQYLKLELWSHLALELIGMTE